METDEMKTMKFILTFLTLVLLGMPSFMHAQMSRELQVPMSSTPVLDASEMPTYEGMNSTSPYNNSAINGQFGMHVATQRAVDAEVQNMYRTTYDEQSTIGSRTKRRLGDDDDEGDAADGKEHTEQPGDVLPIGEGLWLLVLAAMAYSVYTLRRLRKEDEAEEAVEE